MADEHDDPEIEEPEDSTAEEPEPTPAAKPGRKPGTGRVKAGPARGEVIEVDARHYARVLDRLDRLEQESRSGPGSKPPAGEKPAQAAEAGKAPEPPKDWQRVLARRDAEHKAQLASVEKERDRYREALRSDVHRRAIGEAIDGWNKANPAKKVRDNMREFLQKSLSTEFTAEWDEEDGQFVLVQPKTNLPAGDVIHKLLAREDYAGFLEATTPGGAGGRGGTQRPGAGTGGGPEKEGKPTKKATNPIMADYFRRQQLFEQSGARPSIGLSYNPTFGTASED